MGKDINFSTNWNAGKLNNTAFTTIRLYNPKKYVIGSIKRILLKEEFLKEAEVISVCNFKLESLNDFMAYLDTGYSAFETKEILKKMYPGKNEFSIILLKTVKK